MNKPKKVYSDIYHAANFNFRTPLSLYKMVPPTTAFYLPLATEFTLDEWASYSRNALNLCDIILREVQIACRIQEWRGAEKSPQLGGDCLVPNVYKLSTDIKTFSGQSAVAKDADTEKKWRKKTAEMV